MEYLSQEGLERLKEELRELKTVKRKDLAARLAHAKSLGDLSENAEYQEAKEEQALLESQIAEFEERLRNSVLIQGARPSGVVSIGSTVRVRSPRGEVVYKIVGSEESNPAEGRISNESPIGKSLLGRKAKDSVEVKTPSGVVAYEILEIS